MATKTKQTFQTFYATIDGTEESIFCSSIEDAAYWFSRNFRVIVPVWNVRTKPSTP